MATDAKIQDVAVAFIRKGAATPSDSCTLGSLHAALVDQFTLKDGELVLVSSFYSNESWHVFTTRRLVSRFRGVTQELDPSRGTDSDFPNFKGFDFSKDWDMDNSPDVRSIPMEVATVTSKASADVVRFEFETWTAAMYPIWAERYWNVKHPFIEKLMTTAERENYRARRG